MYKLWRHVYLRAAGGLRAAGADCTLAYAIVRPTLLSASETLGNVTVDRTQCRRGRLSCQAPQYLDCCIPVSDVASRRHLRSARRHHLVVPRHSLSSYGRRAFAVAGLAAWNSMSDDLRDPTLSTDSFRRLLKTHLFSEY